MLPLGFLEPPQGWDTGYAHGIKGGPQDTGEGLPRPVTEIRGDYVIDRHRGGAYKRDRWVGADAGH